LVTAIVVVVVAAVVVAEEVFATGLVVTVFVEPAPVPAPPLVGIKLMVSPATFLTAMSTFVDTPLLFNTQLTGPVLAAQTPDGS
jgi:hypothetical protein